MVKGIIVLHRVQFDVDAHVAISSILYYCRYNHDDYTSLTLQEGFVLRVKETPNEIDSLIARNINPFAFAYNQSVIDQILNKPTSVPQKPLSGLSPSITVTDELHNEPIEARNKWEKVKCRDCAWLETERTPNGKSRCTLYNKMPIENPDEVALCDTFKEVTNDKKE